MPITLSSAKSLIEGYMFGQNSEKKDAKSATDLVLSYFGNENTFIHQNTDPLNISSCGGSQKGRLGKALDGTTKHIVIQKFLIPDRGEYDFYKYFSNSPHGMEQSSEFYGTTVQQLNNELTAKIQPLTHEKSDEYIDQIMFEIGDKFGLQVIFLPEQFSDEFIYKLTLTANGVCREKTDTSFMAENTLKQPLEDKVICKIM